MKLGRQTNKSDICIIDTFANRIIICKHIQWKRPIIPTKNYDNNIYTNKKICIFSGSRMADNKKIEEINQVTLKGDRIRGALAMLLEEICEGEETDKNIEAWNKIKKGLHNKYISSGEAKSLINHIYSIMGKADPRVRARDLMMDAQSSPSDQIEFTLKHQLRQDHPNFRVKKLASGSDNRKPESHKSRPARKETPDKRHRSREPYRRSRDRTLEQRRVTPRKHKDNNEPSQDYPRDWMTHKSSESDPQYASQPYEIRTNHIRCYPGTYTAFPNSLWPKEDKIRTDVSLSKITFKAEPAYWKDDHITEYHPTALIGITPLNKLKSFYHICALFRAAKSNKNYRTQLEQVLSKEIC